MKLNLKFPNPLNKGEMRAASMNTGDYVDMVQGPWQGVNVLSLVLALSSLIVAVLVVLLYYYKYTSLYYWLAYPALVIVVLVADRLYINHYAPESLLFVECRRKNLPLGRIHWGNGMETWEPLYKDKKGSLFFKRFGKIFGLDMTLYNEARSSFCRGLEIIDYNTDALLPYGGLHAASVFQSVDYLRSPENNYRRLSALPNLQMMTLVSKPLSEAADIVYRYVDVERKPGMTDDEYKNLVEAEAQELLKEVRRAQEELRSLPVLHGVFNWNVIAQVMNTQLDVKWAQDMESEIRNETINEEQVMRSRMNWAIIVVAIIIAGGIAGLLILSQLH